MANNQVLHEGQSIMRPPLFNGDNYPYWQKRMENFILSQDMDMWDIIQEGPYIPYTTVGEGDAARRVEKTRAQYTDEDKRKVQLNYKAMNSLLCALSEKEFSRVQLCENAKEVWDSLKNTYEETTQVKEIKATWSDEGDTPSEAEDEEEANFCLMANGSTKDNTGVHTGVNSKVHTDVHIEVQTEPSISYSPDSEQSSYYTFDELQEAFDNLACDFETVSLKYQKKLALLKNENAMLHKEKEELEVKIKSLEINVHELTRKNEALEEAFSAIKSEVQKQPKPNDTGQGSAHRGVYRSAQRRQHHQAKRKIWTMWIPKGSNPPFGKVVGKPLNPRFTRANYVMDPMKVGDHHSKN